MTLLLPTLAFLVGAAPSVYFARRSRFWNQRADYWFGKYTEECKRGLVPLRGPDFRAAVGQIVTRKVVGEALSRATSSERTGR